MTVTTADKLKEAKRELAMRKRNYPKWVAAGTLDPEKAARQTAIMEAIAADYEAKAEAEKPQGSLGL
jgi:hypothetical protein